MTYNTSTLMTLCSPESRSPRIAENQLAARVLNGEESPPRQLTAPADWRVRDPAHAVASTAAVPIGGAGSVHRRTGMRAASALPGDRNRPGSSPATDCRQNPPPASPVNQTRCFADHHPVWGCDAGADVRRADGACMMGRARAARSAPHNTASTQTRPILCQLPKPTENGMEVQNDTQRTLRARGVNPAESHAARC